MAITKEWQPLTEVLKTVKFDNLITKLKSGSVKARGDFLTDQMYEERESGQASCDEDGNFPKNIQEIEIDCWERYKFNPSNNTIGIVFSTKQGNSGWYNYSEIEIIDRRRSLEDKGDKISSRESEIHCEIGETYSLLSTKYAEKKISATMVWNYLKKSIPEDSCIIRFTRNDETKKQIIEWQSATGKISYLERSTFNNIVSLYRTGKKSI